MLTATVQQVVNLSKLKPECDKFKLLVQTRCDFSLGEIENPAGTYMVSQYTFNTKSIKTPQNYGAIWRSLIVEYFANTNDVCVIQIPETGATYFIGTSFPLTGASFNLVNFQFPILVGNDFTLIITNYRAVGTSVADNANIYLTNEVLNPAMQTTITSSVPV